MGTPSRTDSIARWFGRLLRLLGRTEVLLALTVLVGPLSNILLREGMRQVTDPAGTWANLSGVLSGAAKSLPVWLGIAARLGFLMGYLTLLSRIDYSFVTPVTSVSYILLLLMGRWILGEAVSAERWLGVLLICAGVMLVSRTPANTTPMASLETASSSEPLLPRWMR